MEGWQIGLIVLVAIGLVVIVFGAVRDRRLNARRREEMLAPPAREIPRFSPDTPAPSYLSELQARRPPEDAPSTELSDEERQTLRTTIEQPGVTHVDAGYATDDLVTDRATGWSVLTRPDVLVSDAPVSQIRELLGVLERQVPTGRPLVVVAPAIGQELVSTFAVNHIRRVITILPIIAVDADVRARIAAATGAIPLASSDLQSGYVAPGQLGSCRTWVATPTASHLIDAPIPS